MRYATSVALIALVLLGASRPSFASSDCTATWFHGAWRLSADKSVEAFSFLGTVATGTFRERVRDSFGGMTHLTDAQRFTVAVERPDGTTQRVDAGYRVASCTSSTVTLRFSKADWPDLTLYRTQGCYMIRSGNNFEHFCHQAM